LYAHRINTIIDADLVIVLDQGQVRECDTPANLLRQEGSLFSNLVNETGKQNAEFLRSVAAKQFRVFN